MKDNIDDRIFADFIATLSVDYKKERNGVKDRSCKGRDISENSPFYSSNAIFPENTAADLKRRLQPQQQQQQQQQRQQQQQQQGRMVNQGFLGPRHPESPADSTSVVSAETAEEEFHDTQEIKQ